jgi:hypothetical protein
MSYSSEVLYVQKVGHIKPAAWTHHDTFEFDPQFIFGDFLVLLRNLTGLLLLYDPWQRNPRLIDQRFQVLDFVIQHCYLVVDGILGDLFGFFALARNNRLISLSYLLKLLLNVEVVLELGNELLDLYNLG